MYPSILLNALYVMYYLLVWWQVAYDMEFCFSGLLMVIFIVTQCSSSQVAMLVVCIHRTCAFKPKNKCSITFIIMR